MTPAMRSKKPSEYTSDVSRTILLSSRVRWSGPTVVIQEMHHAVIGIAHPNEENLLSVIASMDV